MTKFPLINTDYYANNSVPSVESVKLIAIIEAKGDKTEEGQNAQIFIILKVLLIKRHFKICIQAL